MTAAAIAKALRESSLLGDLGDEERVRIARFCREMIFEAGDLLFREGDPAEKLYIVLQGTVAIEVGLLGRQRRRCASIAAVRCGDSAGWSAGIGSKTYLASAYAVEKTSAIAIDGKAFQLLYADNPSSGLLVMGKLVDLARSRLSRTTGMLATMLSTAVHDLKTNLAAVQSLQQVVSGGYVGEISGQQKAMLTRAGERIKGLVSMIDDISEMPRLEPCKLQKEFIPVEEIARNCLENARSRAAGKQIELAADWGTEMPAVLGDRALLELATNNLLGNAIKFTQSGGRVTFRIADENEGRETLIEIIDNGPGIDAQELSRIFDDFYRGKDAPIEGAGLGLSNARRIIEAHGGRIWAESPCPGSEKGARIIFTLPKATSRPDPGAKEEISSHESGN